MAQALFKGKTVVTSSLPVAVPDLIAHFNQVGKFQVAGADLENGVNIFPDALNLLTKGKRPQGSEPAIIKAYVDVVQKLNVLCGHLSASITPGLTLARTATKQTDVKSAVPSSLALVPYNRIRVLPAEVPDCWSVPETDTQGENSQSKKSTSESLASDISTLLGGFPLLTWLFGPTLHFLHMCNFMFVPVKRCVSCLPQIILVSFIYLAVYAVAKVLSEPEVIIDLLLTILSAIPKYVSFAIPRLGLHTFQILSNSVPNIVTDPSTMSGMVYQLPLFSIACWMLGRVGR